MSERSLGLNRGWAQAANGPAYRGTADAEQLGQFGRAVGAGVAELEQVPGLVDGQLRLLPAQASLGLGDLHALPGPHPDQVRLELRDHRQHVEQQPTDWIGRIVHRAAQAEFDVASSELVEDVAGVRQRPGQAIKLGHHQRVAAVAGRQRQPQAGSVPVVAGQAVVNVDAVITDAESGEAVALRGQILLFGGHTRVAHPELVHRPALADTFGPVKPRPAAPDPSRVRLWSDVK